MIVLSCAGCGAAFSVYPCHVRAGARFCSRRCAGHFGAPRAKTVRLALAKAKRAIVVCAGCGEMHWALTIVGEFQGYLQAYRISERKNTSLAEQRL